jgi:hypothetical protein
MLTSRWNETRSEYFRNMISTILLFGLYSKNSIAFHSLFFGMGKSRRGKGKPSARRLSSFLNSADRHQPLKLHNNRKIITYDGENFYVHIYGAETFVLANFLLGKVSWLFIWVSLFLKYFNPESHSFHYRLHSMLPFDWFLSNHEHLHLNFCFPVGCFFVKSRQQARNVSLIYSTVWLSLSLKAHARSQHSACGESEIGEEIPRLISNVYFSRQTAFFWCSFLNLSTTCSITLRKLLWLFTRLPTSSPPLNTINFAIHFEIDSRFLQTDLCAFLNRIKVELKIAVT